MAKEKPKTAEIIPAKKQRKPPTHKLDIHTLLEIQKNNPNITHKQLAKLSDADVSSISKCFARYGIKQQHLDAFKINRADILAGIQETVASTFTEDDIKGASLRDRTILFGTLYDKERLERGQSTQNVATILASTVVEATRLRGTDDAFVCTQEGVADGK